MLFGSLLTASTALAQVFDIVPKEYRVEVNLFIVILSEVYSLTMLGFMALHKFIFYVALSLYTIAVVPTLIFAREKQSEESDTLDEPLLETERKDSSSSDAQRWMAVSVCALSLRELSVAQESASIITAASSAIDTNTHSVLVMTPLDIEIDDEKKDNKEDNKEKIDTHNETIENNKEDNKDSTENKEDNKDSNDNKQDNKGINDDNNDDNKQSKEDMKEDNKHNIEDTLENQSENKEDDKEANSEKSNTNPEEDVEIIEENNLHIEINNKKDNKENTSDPAEGAVFSVDASASLPVQLIHALHFLCTHRTTLVLELMLACDVFFTEYYASSYSVLISQGVIRSSDPALSPSEQHTRSTLSTKLASAAQISQDVLVLVLSLSALPLFRLVGPRVLLLLSHAGGAAALIVFFFITELSRRILWLVFVLNSSIALARGLSMAIASILLVQHTRPAHAGLFLGTHTLLTVATQLAAHVLFLVLNMALPTWSRSGTFYMQRIFLINGIAGILGAAVVLFFPPLHLTRTHSAAKTDKSDAHSTETDTSYPSSTPSSSSSPFSSVSASAEYADDACSESDPSLFTPAAFSSEESHS